ncbi:phosphatidate cytidylyltransferase [Suttonella sp. R2A3]|nr:phosphatidate cytidylyltransferase [Suttonella sp. R2A3]UJF24637.1 phosphatidate cytidylyltransferase [Suttonella sp. R2A3]
MLKQRIITALIAGLLFIAVNLLVHHSVWMVFWAALISLAAYETARLVPLVDKQRLGFVAINALLALLAIAIGLYHPNTKLYTFFQLLLWFAALLWLSVVPWQLSVYAQKGRLSLSEEPLALLNTIFFCAFAFAVAMCWREIGGLKLLGLFVLVWCNDIGAYFAGKYLGKHSLAKAISPNKTLEGFIGGWVFSMICAVIYALIFNLPVFVFNLPIGLVSFVVFSALVLAFAPIGDLWESTLKRQAGSKTVVASCPAMVVCSIGSIAGCRVWCFGQFCWAANNDRIFWHTRFYHHHRSVGGDS